MSAIPPQFLRVTLDGTPMVDLIEHGDPKDPLYKFRRALFDEQNAKISTSQARRKDLMEQIWFMQQDLGCLTDVSAGFPPLDPVKYENAKCSSEYQKFMKAVSNFEFNSKHVTVELPPILPSPKPLKRKLPEAGSPVEWDIFVKPEDTLLVPDGDLSFPEIPLPTESPPPLPTTLPSESMIRIFEKYSQTIPPLEDYMFDQMDPPPDRDIDLERHYVKGKHVGLASVVGKKRIGKAMSTKEWKTVWEEQKVQMVLDKIEKLKNKKLWSFAQPKKQQLPKCRKTHWDYLLDEMEWLQTDFRMEKRQKIADARNLAKEVELWHMMSPEERVSSGLVFVPPKRHTSSEEEKDNTNLNEINAEEAKPSAMVDTVKSKMLAPDQIMYARDNIFNLPDTKTVISERDLDLSGIPEDVKGLDLTDLFPELPLYGPPDASPLSLATSERLDPSDIRHSKMFPLNPMVGDKNWLLSTLQPSQNVEDGRWKDMKIIAGVQRPYSSVLLNTTTLEKHGQIAVQGNKAILPTPRQPSTSAGQVQGPADSRSLTCALFTPTGKHNMSSGSILFQIPDEPEDAANRAQQLGWTQAEDLLLYKLVLTYSPNWVLIADLFNASTPRVHTDKRTTFDIFDRFNKRYPTAAKSMMSALRYNVGITRDRETRERSNTGATNRPSVPPIASEFQHPQPQFPGNANISTRSATAAANAASTSKEVALMPPNGMQGGEDHRKAKRHKGLVEVLKKKTVKDAEAAKKRLSNRRINLGAHDSHTYAMPSKTFFFNPVLWSKFKHQQDVRRQQEFYQQLQQQAVQHAMQQQHAQAQQQQQQQQQMAQNGTPNQHTPNPLQPAPVHPAIGAQRLLQGQSVQQVPSPQQQRASPFPLNISQSGAQGPVPNPQGTVPPAAPGMYRGTSRTGPLTPIQSAQMLHRYNNGGTPAPQPQPNVVPPPPQASPPPPPT